MFQFPTFAFLTEFPINREGCPIRTSTDQTLLAGPRSFSQLITSFFASESLGIPRAPLFTYFLLFCPDYSGRLLQFLLNMSMNLVTTLM